MMCMYVCMCKKEGKNMTQRNAREYFKNLATNDKTVLSTIVVTVSDNRCA